MAISNLIKSGVTAFDTLKKGGTATQALTAANNLLQNKGPIATPSPVTNSPVKINNPTLDIINKVTEANKAVNNPTRTGNLVSTSPTVTKPTTTIPTVSEALQNNLGPVIAQQPVQPAPTTQPDISGQITQLINEISKIQQPNIQPYQSKYDSQIGQIINDYNNLPEFKFDATNNPTIQAYQKKAADAVTQEMGRRNILNSTITGNTMADRIADVFATVAPQLQQQEFNQYQTQKGNLIDQLNLLRGLDTDQRNIWSNNADMANDQYTNTINKVNSIINLLSGREDVADTKAQNAINNEIKKSSITGYLNPYPGEEISPDVAKYSSNYAQYAKDFANDNDPSNDSLIPELQKASVIKMFDNPELLSKYGDQYKTAEQKAIDLNAEIEAQKLALEADPNSYDNQLKYMKLAQAQEELNQLATYGPQEAAAKIKQIDASASASYASANASNALATQRKNEGSTSASKDDLTYKDYYKAGTEMVQAGNYDSTSGVYNKRYTDDQIFNWIKGLPLTGDKKAKLANDIGLQKTQATQPAQPAQNNISGFENFLSVNGLKPY